MASAVPPHLDQHSLLSFRQGRYYDFKSALGSAHRKFFFCDPTFCSGCTEFKNPYPPMRGTKYVHECKYVCVCECVCACARTRVCVHVYVYICLCISKHLYT